MSWFRLDDQGAFHAKVIMAGNEAYGAWCRAGQWSSAHLTEGLIPRDTALSIAPARVWRKLIAAKANSEHGLVEARGDNFQIHDYLVYNPTAAEVLAKRAARSEAGKLGGKRSAQARATKKPTPAQASAGAIAEANVQAIAEAKVEQSSTPIPIPIPIPEDQTPNPPPNLRPDPGSGVENSARPAGWSAIAVGTASCEAAVEVFVSAVSEAIGRPLATTYRRSERESICAAVNALHRDGETVHDVLPTLRRSLGEWVDAYRERPHLTAGWQPRRFVDWLNERDAASPPAAVPPPVDYGPPAPPPPGLLEAMTELLGTPESDMLRDVSAADAERGADVWFQPKAGKAP